MLLLSYYVQHFYIVHIILPETSSAGTRYWYGFLRQLLPAATEQRHSYQAVDQCHQWVRLCAQPQQERNEVCRPHTGL